jgi:hypothetical protein
MKGSNAGHEIRTRQRGLLIDIEPEEAEWTLTIAESMLHFYVIEPAKAAKRTAEFK